MIEKIVNTLKWLPYYLQREVQRKLTGEYVKPKHIYFCICDHFEPYRGKADRSTASKRIMRWLDNYPNIAGKYHDSDGRLLKYTFFYPEEEYRKADLDELSKLCKEGFGEVEIHLHHDGDTSENLKRVLVDYKKRLHEQHGLLSLHRQNGEISYGFIHGNWALDNSCPDGRWCGVNDEITILQETGCFADFTMPSAPHGTQTKKVNSIYYAVDDRNKPKSHDWGIESGVGKLGEGLLMIQGPLCPNWKKRKFGFFPGIENSGLYGLAPPSIDRVSSWVDVGICVKGAPERIFVKLYTHGAQEDVSEMLFDGGGFEIMFESLKEHCEKIDSHLHFVSARELTNVVIGIVADENLDSRDIYDFRYT